MASSLYDVITGIIYLGVFVLLSPLLGLVMVIDWVGNLFRSRVPDPRTVLITGAGSGLGRELALQYAAKPTTRALFLTDINAKGLQETQAMITGRPRATPLELVVTKALDVRNRAEMADWIGAMDATAPIDLVIAVAGIVESMLGPYMVDYPEITSLAVVDVNAVGVVNTVTPLIPRFIARRSGSIAILSSMSAFLPCWPSFPSYASTKAFVKSWGLALRSSLRNFGITVTVLTPGFIRTPMTENPVVGADGRVMHAGVVQLPLLMNATAAVATFIDGISRDAAVVAFPLPLSVTTFILNALPPAALDAILRWRALPELGFRIPLAARSKEAEAAVKPAAKPAAAAAAAAPASPASALASPAAAGKGKARRGSVSTKTA